MSQRKCFKELLNKEFLCQETEEEWPTKGVIPSWTQEGAGQAIGKLKIGKAVRPDGLSRNAL